MRIPFAVPSLAEVLKKAIQEDADKSRLTIKVVEKGGWYIKSVVQRLDVQPNKKCNKPSCIIFLTSDKYE